jgi:hypothetical protein
VSTRPSKIGGQDWHGVNSSRTTMPPSAISSATLSGREADGLPESRKQRERAPVEQRRPVGGQHLHLVVVAATAASSRPVSLRQNNLVDRGSDLVMVNQVDEPVGVEVRDTDRPGLAKSNESYATDP